MGQVLLVDQDLEQVRAVAQALEQAQVLEVVQELAAVQDQGLELLHQEPQVVLSVLLLHLRCCCSSFGCRQLGPDLAQVLAADQ